MALKPLNSVAGFSVGETPANVIYANGDVTANNFIATAKSNLGPVGNVFISGGTSAQVIQTDGFGNLSFVTIDTWRVQNGNSNVQVAANSNVTISVSGNANIATFTGTGANISGYLTVDGNVTANGNLSANNYLVTPATKDLIIAPATTLTRFYSNVNPYTDGAYSLGNGLARWTNIYTGEANVTGNANVGSLRTNNLLYANGNPWDLQEAAGSNTQIQYNDGLNNFGASANFTFDSATGNLKVTGNANITANLSAGNAALGNLATANYVNVTNQINGNIANFSGNLTALNADLGNLATANYVNVANEINGNIANFSGNLTALNADLGNLATANYVNVANEINGNIANFSGNLTALNADLGNLATANYVNVANEINGNIANFSGNLTSLNAGLGNLATANYVNVANQINGNIANFSGNLTSLNADLGNLATANYVNVANQINGNIANFSGNLTSLNAALGNLATANYVNVANEVNGNIANFSGNLTALNADLGNLAVANYVNVANQINGNIANFSGNLTSLNAALGNLATANFANVSSNLNVTNTANVGNLRTNNLLYANGVPWDLQEAAGSNTQIQYNDGLNNFGASANFTFDYAGNVLKVDGNANVTGTTKTQNANLTSLTATQVVYGNTNSYLVGSSSFTYNDVTKDLTVGNTVYANYFVGNISGNLAAPGANTDIIFNDNNIANAVANFTYNKAFNSGGGQLNVGNTVGGNIITDNLAANNITAATLLSTASLSVSLDANITGNANVTGNISGNNISASGNISTTGAGGNITMSGGNITGVNEISANSANYSSNVRVNNLTVNLQLSGNVGNFTGNITSLNANLGNLATANYINVANDLNVLGNITGANLVGALANGNSNVKVYSNANVEITVGGVSNIATFASTGLYVVGTIESTLGNIVANGNITANGFLNGANANVTGQANVSSLLTSNITSTGNLTITTIGTDTNINLVPGGPNGVIDVSLARIIQVADPTNPNDAATKEYVDNVVQGLSIHFPVVVTSTTNLTSTYNDGGTALTTTDITGNKTIQFSANHGLSIGDEIYWTNSFNGITALNAYFVYSVPALNQITVKDGFSGSEVITLTNGTGLTQAALGNPGVGATLTNAGANTAISIDSIALSSTNRVLVQGQTNAYENGVYVVSTVGAPDSPGPGSQWVLTRSSDADTYDPKSITGLSSGDYFFVQQGSGYAGSSYVLTSPVGEILFGVTNIGFTQFSAAGSYSAGSGIDITGTTISANVDNVTTAIVAGNITVKVGANLTTPNIGDATFSSLTWNNLSNGNVTANNLSIGNVANITGSLVVGTTIQANGNISSNANVNGNNAFFTNFVNIGANLLANYITANYTVFAANSNVSGTTITNALTVNLDITGNTANFSGNIYAPAIIQNASTYDTRISLNSGAGIIEANTNGNATQFLPGGTMRLPSAGSGQIVGGTFDGSQLTLASDATLAQIRGGNVTIQTGAGGTVSNTWTFAQDGSFTSPGNINSLNANLGNLAIANYFTGTLINGTSNVSIPVTNGNVNIRAGGNTSLVVTATGANIVGNLDVTSNVTVTNLVGTNVTANSSVFIGDTGNLTSITWGSVTTSSVTANQTIASLSATGITGLEFLVKAVDAGGKYSVATVQAVTDGTAVDYATFGTVQLGGYTGSLAVNIVGGFVRLQVTPASSNSTVWTTQARTI